MGMRHFLWLADVPSAMQPDCNPKRDPSSGASEAGGLAIGGPALSARVPPERRGLGVGLRLGLLVTLIVAGVMAAVTSTQLVFDLRSELRERQSLLHASLSPLVAQLQIVSTREEARGALTRFHSSYIDRGHAHHYLAVMDSGGRVIIDAGEQGAAGPPSLLRASVPLTSSALGPQRLELVVAQDSAEFSADRARRWRAWAMHVGLTALLILSLLFIVIRREITGPIERLLHGIRKMELGYWDDMPDPGGAWEVRWLGWRFRTLGQELSLTVEQLVAAQRRAYGIIEDAHARSPSATPLPALRPSLPQQPAGEALERVILLCRLQARLERLRRAEPGDVELQALAQHTWDHDPHQAELLGQPGLRMSLENAALRVLDPKGYGEIERQLEAQRPRLDALAKSRSLRIQRALTARGVPVVDVSHRVKHLAGIWKKMREKDLTLDQVHDLIALRIVVPTESDCYRALGAVHDIHAPIVGRFKDYIVDPKPNGYRSLHTSVRGSDGSVFEVQIRSIAMHQFAEHGQAAHANYKEASWIPVHPERLAKWKRVLGI